MLKKTDNPWLGLASYEYEDAYRFFGRERELEELKTTICDNPFTTIYGISGAGKTSLINAGMIPLLEKDSYMPVRIRLDHQSKIGYNSQIITAIKNTVDEIKGEVEYWGNTSQNDEIDEDERLWDFLYLSRIWSKTNHQLVPVIFIDQFEEIFTKNEDPGQVTRFFEAINSLQYNTPPTHISEALEGRHEYIEFNDVAQFRMVFVMREDFLARLEDYSIDIPALRRNRRGIKRMDGLQALEVILKPRPGIVSREVAFQILGKVVGKEVHDSEAALSRLSVDTSILSLFCSELYQKASEANADVIAQEIVGEFGDDIISSFYEDTMTMVSAETMEYIEAHLLTYSGFRNTVALEDMLQNGIQLEDLQKLADKRLLRIETSDGTERVEFMHDVLCKVAKEHRDGRKSEKAIKQEINVENKGNFRFVASTILGLALFAFPLFDKSGIFLIGYFPDVALLSLTLCGIYGLLFGKKMSDHLTARYILVGALAMLIVVGTMLINRFFFLSSFFYNRHGLPTHTYLMTLGLLFLPFFLCLLSSYIIERHSKNQTLIRVFKIACFVLLQVPVLFLYHNPVALVLGLFAIVALNPYRFTKEKNVRWITVIFGLALTLSILMVGGNWSDTWIIVSGLVLVWTVLASVISGLKYTVRKRSPREAWNYCISMDIYSEKPFYRKTMLVLSSLLVLLLSFLIGKELSNQFTILGIALLVPAAYVLVKGFFPSPTEEKRGVRITPVTILLVLFMACIIASQYLYGRLIWMAVLWALSLIVILKMSPLKGEETEGVFKYKYIPNLIAWFVAFFCIPFICMGFNVFSLPMYARVYEQNPKSRSKVAFHSMTIRNNKGQVGARDRLGLLVPTAYKTIEMDKRSVVYRPSEFQPWVDFYVTDSTGSSAIWDCSDHLDLKNYFSRAYVEYCENAIERIGKSSYSYVSDDMVHKYLRYLSNMKDNEQKQHTVEKVFLYHIKDKTNYSYRTIKELDHALVNGDVVIEAKTFNDCVSQCAPYFSYLNSLDLSRFIVDSLYVQCRNYSTTVNYRSLAFQRIVMNDYERAVSDAELAVSRNERAAETRLVEALYFNGAYDKAFSMLANNKDLAIDWGNDESEIMSRYKYFGDIVWQDLVAFKGIGALKDTLSPHYLELEKILESEKSHPGYYYVVPFSTFCPNHDDKELCIGLRKKYLMRNHEVISPVMRSFAFSDDGKTMLIVDDADGKRKYMDLSGDDPILLEGVFDHAWRFSEGLAVVSMNNRISIIDQKGSPVIEATYAMPNYYCYGKSMRAREILFKYDDIFSRENPHFVDFVFQNGTCPMSGDNGRFGLIDQQGNWVVEPVYDYIGEPDKKGNRIVGVYEGSLPMRGYDKITRYGMINRNGRIVIPVEKASIEDF